jgi:hypothetical protein
MGVLDDAIREHLDLKRRRGASDEEIARAEAEALGPARRAIPASEHDERVADDLVALAEETRVLDTKDDEPPAPSKAREPTHAVHDIDEDPLAPPAPVERSAAKSEQTEDDAGDEGDVGDEPDPEPEPEPPPPVHRTPRLDQPIRWPPESGDGQDDR